MQPRTSNDLLERLGEGGGASLRGAMTPVTLALGDVVQEAGAPIRYAYFPAGAVVSLVTVLRSGDQNEAGIIGRRGMVGALGVLGQEWLAPWRSIVQIEGEALQVE